MQATVGSSYSRRYLSVHFLPISPSSGQPPFAATVEIKVGRTEALDAWRGRAPRVVVQGR